MRVSPLPLGCHCRAFGPSRVSLKSAISCHSAGLVLLCTLIAVVGMSGVLSAAKKEPPDQNRLNFDLLTAGWELTPEDVGVLEARAAKKPDDVDARMLLVSCYFQQAKRDDRLRHVFWMIEHQPDSDRFDFRGMGIRSFEPLGGPANFQRAKDLWIGQVAKHPESARVHANAARMIEQDEPEQAIEWWRRARALEPDNRHWAFHLGRLSALVLRTDGRIHPRTPWSAERQAFANRTLAELRASDDAAVIGVAGSAVAPLLGPAAAKLKQRGASVWPPHGDMTELAEELFQRARELQPDEPRWDRRLEQIGQTRREPASAEGLSSGVASTDPPRLLNSVEPRYPPIVTGARIQGSVRLQVNIGTDGKVKGAKALSGHPLLVPPALAAVSQWQYEPVLDADGQPAEATFEVQVPFRMEP